MTPAFMFATGIENSDPTIQNGKLRVDEMARCGHYEHWETDFDLVEEMGIRFLRYGMPLHRAYLGHGRYDWSFADVTFNDLRRRDILPITDLCHFGVPDWIGDFQNPDFPQLFADYADAFARRYPWIQLYTPINEMYVCARRTKMQNWISCGVTRFNWNESHSSPRRLVRRKCKLRSVFDVGSNSSGRPYSTLTGCAAVFRESMCRGCSWPVISSRGMSFRKREVMTDSFNQDQGVLARRIRSPIGRPTTAVADARMTSLGQSKVSRGPMCFLKIVAAVATRSPMLAR